MSRCRVAAQLLILPSMFAMLACGQNARIEPDPTPQTPLDDFGQSEEGIGNALAACVADRHSAAADRYANEVRLGAARASRDASIAANRAEMIRAGEALALQRSQGKVPRRGTAAFNAFMQAQFFSSWATKHSLRIDRAERAADVVAYGASLTAADWRAYADYAELRARTFAYADSADKAETSADQLRFEAQRDEILGQLEVLEEETPEMGAMYVFEFATELDRGPCQDQMARSGDNR